jgi:hypothetical protein
MELCRRVRADALAGTRVLGFTDPAPAPPFVTSRRTPPETLARLRAAVRAAMDDCSLQSARHDLLLDGVELLAADSYESLRRFEEPALAAGYFELPSPAASPLSQTSAGGRRAASAVAGRAGCAIR